VSVGVRLDHLVLGAPDLAAGVAPASGGVHPTMGTANALLSLGGGVYLEVMAPAPGQAEPSGNGRQLAGLPGPTLGMWAARAADLDAVASAARAAGLNPRGPIPGSRRTEAGELLEWRMLFIDGHAFGTLVPFFIDWGATPHPSTTSPAGARLIRFSLGHPHAAELRRILEALGVDVEVAEGPVRMTAEIEGLSGPAVLMGP